MGVDRNREPRVGAEDGDYGLNHVRVYGAAEGGEKREKTRHIITVCQCAGFV